MPTPVTDRVLRSNEENFTIEDFKSSEPRWCTGCGNNAILTALQRLCRDEKLLPEKTVFVSGIGCSSRFPHYMNTYGFHGLHGRALPIAEGIKMARPDLNIFVNTGDGDCCSIGTAHWIHAIRYNMNMTVLMHDNQLYGLTKNQVSPTSPQGLSSNTTPRGSYLEPLNPLSVTLGITNASFVAQAADWIPEVLHAIISTAFRHQGFSFVRILQRCPEYVPTMFDTWINDPDKTLMLHHQNGMQIPDSLNGVYKNREEHDPLNLDRAREIAAMTDSAPVGILYHNKETPRYDDIRDPDTIITADTIETAVNGEFDKYTIWPDT